MPCEKRSESLSPYKLSDFEKLWFCELQFEEINNRPLDNEQLSGMDFWTAEDLNTRMFPGFEQINLRVGPPCGLARRRFISYRAPGEATRQTIRADPVPGLWINRRMQLDWSTGEQPHPGFDAPSPKTKVRSRGRPTRRRRYSASCRPALARITFTRARRSLDGQQ